MRFLALLAIVLGSGTAFAQGRLPPPINLPFDAAYMVAAPGATTPLTNFALDGAPPTLLLDLPPGASYDWFSAVWSTWRRSHGRRVQRQLLLPGGPGQAMVHAPRDSLGRQ